MQRCCKLLDLLDGQNWRLLTSFSLKTLDGRLVSSIFDFDFDFEFEFLFINKINKKTRFDALSLHPYPWSLPCSVQKLQKRIFCHCMTCLFRILIRYEQQHINYFYLD